MNILPFVLCHAFSIFFVSVIRFIFVVDGTASLTDASDISHKLTVRKSSYLHLAISIHNNLQYFQNMGYHIIAYSVLAKIQQ